MGADHGRFAVVAGVTIRDSRHGMGQHVWGRVAISAFAMAIAVAGVVALTRHASSASDDVYVFGGSGWGHGIGLSQYGAFGQALDGRSATQILQHYYTDVSVETIDQLVAGGDVAATHPLVTDAEPVWVGIVQNASEVGLAPIGGAARFCQEFDDGTRCLDIGVGPDGGAETWKLVQASIDGQLGCVLTRDVPPLDPPDPQPLGIGTCRASVVWGAGGQASRVGVNGAGCAAATGWERDCFSRGTLRIREESVASGFHVALEVGLEEYLYGIGEMPSTWPSAALQAQAIAARTYAVHRVLGNEQPSQATANDAGFSESRKAACWCHIYASVADQNYVGYSKEHEAAGAAWVAAVDATAGRVVTHPTATASHATVVIAFYHSSSGGVTETNASVWGTNPQPYLQSVDDSWSNTAAVANPYESWSYEVTAGVLAANLGWDTVSGVELEAGAPGATFRFSGTDDGTGVVDVVPASVLYAQLGTRSPHIDSVRLQSNLPFDDISTSPHVDSIVALHAAGVTGGCADRLFCPDGELTRAQMATFLARILDLTPVAEDQFIDASASPAHAGNINAIAVAGISLGCNADGTEFCPEDVVSRGQMASFLARAMDLAPVTAGGFVDVPPGTNHAGNINALAAAGVTNGCTADGSRYCPDDIVTRAQMASFLVRAFLTGS